MQAQQLTVAVERLNGDIRSITQQISGSESRIAVLETIFCATTRARLPYNRRSPPGSRTPPKRMPPCSATALWQRPWRRQAKSLRQRSRR